MILARFLNYTHTNQSCFQTLSFITCSAERTESNSCWYWFGVWGRDHVIYVYLEHTSVWVWVVALVHCCNTCICILHHSCVLFPWLQHRGDTEGNIQGASCELLSENCESWTTIADTGCSILVLWLLYNQLPFHCVPYLPPSISSSLCSSFPLFLFFPSM